MPAEILDLDKLIPDKRIVKLAGKEIDVSKVPTRVVLEIEKNKDQLEGEASFDLVLDMVCKICKPSFPEISVDWLIDNTDMNQLIAMLEFVMKPIREKAEKMAKGKNEESPSQLSLGESLQE